MKGVINMTQDTKLEVTRLYRSENGGPIKAFCDIQFGDDFIVKGFKVIQGKEGVFIGMPSEPGKNGRWYHTFLTLSDDAKARIEEAIMAAYEE